MNKKINQLKEHILLKENELKELKKMNKVIFLLNFLIYCKTFIKKKKVNKAALWGNFIGISIYLCLIKRDFELISQFYEGYEAVNILEDISLFCPLLSENDHEGRLFNENRYWVKSNFEVMEIVNVWDSL